MTKTERMQKCAPVILRIGLAIVFIWFGFSQIGNPGMWERLIPASVTGFTGLSATTMVLFNGSFEIVFGLCLLFGFFTRVVSLLLALHMIHITLVLVMGSGWNAISIRDLGLSFAAVALFLFGPHGWSIDSWLCTRYEQKQGQV